jgi:hypothetical protein
MLASGTVVYRNAIPTADEVIAVRVRADIAEKMLEITAQRDRWEQRFDQSILSALNAGERRPWWRRIRETTVDNRNVTGGTAFRLPNFPQS